MLSLNRSTILGNLGRDVELKYLPNGTAVADFSVATSESWKDKESGESKDRTEWHSVVIYGKLGEIAAQYGKKGAQVYVEGQLRTRSWEKDGVKRYKTEIVASSFIVLGPRGSGAAAQAADPGADPDPPRERKVKPPRSDLGGDGSPLDDDIPF